MRMSHLHPYIQYLTQITGNLGGAMKLSNRRKPLRQTKAFVITGELVSCIRV